MVVTADPAFTPQSSGEVPSVRAALDLGWRMQQVYRALPERPAQARQPGTTLAGLSDLSKVQRFQRRLDEVEFCLTEVCAGVAWTAAVPQPTTALVRVALEPFQSAVVTTPAPRTRAEAPSGIGPALRAAVNDLHEETLIKLNGADARVGTAYGLGRALADTMRTNQSPDELKDNFDPHRLGQLYGWLGDLASALPPHAAKSVRRSLTWWRDTLFVDSPDAIGQDPRAVVGVLSDAPSLQPLQTTSSRARAALFPRTRGPLTIAEGTTLADPAKKGKAFDDNALQRQGEIWRGLLTGQKQATDVLCADDYLAAAKDNLTLFWRMVSRARGLVIPAAILAAGLAVLVTGIAISNANGASKIGGVLGAIITYLAATGKALGPRVAALAKTVETPLWGDTLDLAIAHAITLPPAGLADPAGWLTFAKPAPVRDGSAPPSPGATPAV